MKNTFAAHRHLPTGAIHILDLALFSKQRLQDGATSLACEYINEDSEKVFAVIASGEQDEPGATYVPLPEKENRESMAAYFAATLVIDWSNGKASPKFREHGFNMDLSNPDHIVATMEFIEPEETINPAANNCTNPLKLTWNARESQYKVNKPLDQSGEYVDKSIADALLAALVDLKERCLVDDPEFNLPRVNAAIELATSGLPIIKHANT